MSWNVLQGRVAVEEILPTTSGLVHLVDGYHKAHERDRKSHRGRVVAMGGPACTRSGKPIAPCFAVGDEVLFVLDKLSDHSDYGSWTEKNREGLWPPGGETKVLWIAQEEVIAVVDDA
jgi:co-chaperonin GroES (HSP10)